jgi:hypothetical protein
MAIFQAGAPASRGQKLFDRIAAGGAFAGCCALGLWEGYSGSQMVGDAAGRSQIAALLAAMAIGLGGLLLGIYWRTRALGFSLLVCGLLSYGVFLGGRVYCTRHGWLAQKPPANLGGFLPGQKFSLVIYFRRGLTAGQIEDFTATVLKNPGQPMHPEAEYPWFVTDHVPLQPDPSNGFRGVALNLRHNAPRSETDSYVAKIRSDRRVEKVVADAQPGSMGIDPAEP